MRRLIPILGAVLLLAGCTERGEQKPAAGNKSKRPVGMSEDIWKVYSGAESGVGDDVKDKPAEKK